MFNTMSNCPRCYHSSSYDAWLKSACFRGTCTTIAKQVENSRKKLAWEIKHRRPRGLNWRWNTLEQQYPEIYKGLTR